MSSTISDRKISEGLEHLRLADKCIKTSFFKWKPDYDGAAAEYAKAAVSFKNAKAYEQALNCYLKAADAQRQMGSPFHAAKSLESGSLICKEMEELDQAADLAEKASQLYLEHGTPDTAALALARAAKMVEASSPEKAIMLYVQGCDIADAEDRPRQSAELIGKAARVMIRTKQLDGAKDALSKEMDFYNKVDNHGMVNKLVMGLVLVHLTQGDYVAADQAFQAALSKYQGFLDCEEAGAIERLLEAYDQSDQEVADEILKSPLFRYMENDFVKLARDLRVPGGQKKSKASPDDQQGAAGDNGNQGQAEDEDSDEYAGGLL